MRVAYENMELKNRNKREKDIINIILFKIVIITDLKTNHAQ